MNRKKKVYGVEDYLQDKQALSSQPTVAKMATATAPTMTQPTTVKRTVAPAAQTAQPTNKTPATITPTTTNAASQSQAVGTNISQPMSLSEQWKMELQAARNKVYEALNKKFTYNEQSSPLYSILQKQYEREAAKAEGMAYARSVANTGGYGSSYATLAGAEARRQTMEGFPDQQAALYEAARNEFLSERESKVDWYNQAKTMYGDSLNQEIADAYDKGIGAWMENRDENAVRDALKKQGYSDAVINDAILMMQEYSATADQYAEATDPNAVTSENVASGVAYLAQNFEGYSENTMRALLQSSGQYSEAEINEIMNQVRNLYKSQVDDVGQAVSGISGAIGYKSELDTALKNGTMSVAEYDAAWEENSRKIMSEVTRNINNLDSIDYASLGISQAEWDGLEDGDRKLAVFDAVGQLVKEGVVAPWQYRNMLYDDTKEMLDSKEYQQSGNQARDLLDRGVILQDLYKDGYLSEDDYTAIMADLLIPAIEKTSAIRTTGNQVVFDLNRGVGDLSEEQMAVVGILLKLIGKSKAHGAHGGR